MNEDIFKYHQNLNEEEELICAHLFLKINAGLENSTSKLWHGHPVWFLDGNPVVGYSKIKRGLRLMFWSGQSFEEKGLNATGKFKAADVVYNKKSDIDDAKLATWLDESEKIQWDYKNIVKRRGKLIRLK